MKALAQQKKQETDELQKTKIEIHAAQELSVLNNTIIESKNGELNELNTSIEQSNGKLKEV